VAKHLEKLAEKVRVGLAPEFEVVGDPTFCVETDGTWSVEVYVQPRDHRMRRRDIRSSGLTSPKSPAKAVEALLAGKEYLL
jgi:hypothetical protein